MDAWLQILFKHSVEIVSLVLMICMGTCLFIIRSICNGKEPKSATRQPL